MSTMTKEQMRERTKQFALRVIRCVDALPRTTAGRVVGSQLVRSGTSVGASYRSALRARSDADFSNKIGVVLEEADESGFWLEIIVDAKLLPESKIAALLTEVNELTAIFAATHKTIKAHARRSNHKSEIRNQK